jgi:glycosyltransferase involved in cell wall biosynthesis
MNIAWIYNKSLHVSIGGTERTTMLAIEMLQRIGHNSYAFIIINEKDGLFSFEGNPINDLYTFLKEKEIDIAINQIGYSIELLKPFLENGGKKWQEEGGKIITYMHFDPRMPSNLDYFLSIENKTITDYLVICKLFLFNRYYKTKERNEYAHIYRYLYDNSDMYVTLSPTHFPYLKSLLNLESYDKLYAINNTLTFDGISSPDILHKKEKTVLLVARLSETHKRISAAIKVWERISKNNKYDEWQFKIVGTGADMERYKRYVKKHKIERISFEGEQNPEPYYRSASIFLMTSPAEGWGLTLTESFQRGVVPVVMNSSPVFSEIIEDGKSGILVKDNNIREFQEAIEKLMSDKQLRLGMGKNCLDRAKLFNKESTTKKWENIIDRLKSN